MFGRKKFLHRNNVPGRLKGLVHLFQPMLHLFGIKSRDFAVNLQFRQWGRVTGKDQRGEDGNELAKGGECGD